MPQHLAERSRVRPTTKRLVPLLVAAAALPGSLALGALGGSGTGNAAAAADVDSARTFACAGTALEVAPSGSSDLQVACRYGVNEVGRMLGSTTRKGRTVTAQLPSGARRGQLLITVVQTGAQSTVGMTGWTKAYDTVSGTRGLRLSAWYRIATAGDSAPVVTIAPAARASVITAAFADADPTTPVVSAGGSAFFDVVDQVLGPLVDTGTRVVLRSGAYLTHDDGFYREVSPLGSTPRTTGPTLRAAIHGWVRVTSQPEPGLALFDAGKRDVPYDEGLPEVQLRRPRTEGERPVPLDGITVTAVNDQHGFLSFDPTGTPPVQVGDELRLGLSHPCTAFDKWMLVPVIDDPDADDPVVVDLIRTWF